MIKALKARIQALREARAKAKVSARMQAALARHDAILAIAKVQIEQDAELARAKMTYEVRKEQ
jgi:hypothetical protein